MQLFDGEPTNERFLECKWARREMSTPHRRPADQELTIGKARFLEDVWNIPEEAIRRQADEADRIQRAEERERQRQERAAARMAATAAGYAAGP